MSTSRRDFLGAQPSAWYRPHGELAADDNENVQWFKSLPPGRQAVVRMLGEALMARWPSPDDMPDVTGAELLRLVMTPALRAAIAQARTA
jgi:hypothetical protein